MNVICKKCSEIADKFILILDKLKISRQRIKTTCGKVFGEPFSQ
jgi:hypothetical protein